MNGNSTLNRHSLDEWYTNLRVERITKLIHFITIILMRQKKTTKMAWSGKEPIKKVSKWTLSTPNSKQYICSCLDRGGYNLP